MIESVLNFGPRSALVGVLSQPAVRTDPSLAVVFLNAGIIHRPGPNRITVRLARALADAGLLSFRIDMAGIGDSYGLGTAASADEECLASVRAALDLLEARGIASTFILFGLCSGADYSLAYATRDPRVVGVAGVDPPGLERSRKFWVVHVSSLLKRPVVWYRLLAGRYGVGRSLLAGLRIRRVVAGDSEASRRRAWRGFAEMAARHVRLLLVITGSGMKRYNYAGQLADLFPGLGLEKISRIRFIPTATHTFAREVDKKALERELVTWASETPFAGAPHAPGGAHPATPRT